MEILRVLTFRNANGEDGVIESYGGSKFRRDDSAKGLSEREIGFDSGFMEHGAEESGFVLTIAVLMAINIAGR